MDWSPTDLQQAAGALARQILATSDDPWAALVEAELLELPGLLEQCTLAIEVGRAGARVPVLETLFLGWPVLQGRPGPAGEVVSAGLVEPESRDPRRPTTRAVGGRLTGIKTCVPAVDRAARLVIPATDGIYAVRTADCAVSPQTGTNGDRLGQVVLRDVPGERLGGLDLLDAWLARIHVGLCGLHLGLCDEALRMTAQHVTSREQFGVPIGSFQAVSQRAADAWIDLQAMEVTLWRAAWRLSAGLPAEREVAIARYWACEGSHRILAAAQHLHGGMGFDRDYPLHRYFLSAKQWEFLLGGAAAQLGHLGSLLARDEDH